MNRRPLVFLALSSVVFTGAALVFRQRVYLLGDSFVFIKSFENTFLGLHPLDLGYAPLAKYYLYVLMKLFEATIYPALMTPIMTGEILLGVGFLAMTFVTVSAWWGERKIRLLAFFFLSSMPYMQLFFGYPETYAMVLFSISLFLMVVTLYLKGKIRFELVLPTFIIFFFSHYLAACIFPSVLFLVIHEVKQHGWTRLLMGMAAGLVTVLLITFSLQLNLADLLPSSANRSHYLSLVTNTDGFQAYTLFSIFHGIDFFNAVVLEASTVLVLIAVLIASRRGALLSTPYNIFLALAVVSFLVVLFVLKFDLGMARDWDVPAPYFLLCSMFVFVLLTEQGGPGKALALLVCAVLMHSLLWFAFNTTTQPSIARAQALMDRKLLSYEGAYESSFHLSMAYKTIGDTAASAALWQEYLTKNPEDTRAYLQLINSLMRTLNKGPNQVLAVYEQWLAHDPNDKQAKYNYAQFCLNAGNFYFNNNILEQAEQFYGKILEVFPTSAVAHNNLGTIYEKRQNFPQAIFFYQKAIECDSLYRDGYWNLGHLYYKLGKEHESLEVAKLAARHGDKSAQEELTSKGLTW